MRRTTEPVEVEVGASYIFIVMAAIFFAFMLVWGLLNEHLFVATEYARDLSTSAEADTGTQRLEWTWKYAPLWGTLALMLYGYRQSVNESRRY